MDRHAEQLTPRAESGKFAETEVSFEQVAGQDFEQKKALFASVYDEIHEDVDWGAVYVPRGEGVYRKNEAFTTSIDQAFAGSLYFFSDRRDPNTLIDEGVYANHKAKLSFEEEQRVDQLRDYVLRAHVYTNPDPMDFESETIMVNTTADFGDFLRANLDAVFLNTYVSSIEDKVNILHFLYEVRAECGIAGDYGTEEEWETFLRNVAETNSPIVSLQAHALLERGADFGGDKDRRTQLKTAYQDRRALVDKKYLAKNQSRGRFSSDAGAVFSSDIVANLAPGYLGVYEETGRLREVYSIDEGTLRPLEELAVFQQPSGASEREQLGMQQVVRDVKQVADLQIREQVEKQFDIPYSELSLREQIWFASTLRQISKGDEERMVGFVRTFGIDGARAFLSAEFGEEFRERVLIIGEKLGKHDAAKVFKAFADISELAQAESSVLLESFFKDGTVDQVNPQGIENELMKRARELIEDFSVECMSARAKQEKPDVDRLLGKLEQVNADTVLFVSIFKSTFKGKKNVDFENLRGLEFGMRLPDSFTVEECQEMLEIFDENWVDQDRLAAESFREDLERGLDPKNTKTHFYATKKDGKIIGFIRFDEREDLGEQAYYVGSFNIRPEYRGSAIGEAIMKNTINQEAQKHVLYAHVVADAVVGTHYVENGLVVTGVTWLEKDGQRVAELAIRQDNEKNATYRARKQGVTHEKLLMGIPGVRVEGFDYKKEKEIFLKAIERASANGEVVTRYWIDPDNKTKRYIALEEDVPSPVNVELVA